MRRTGIRLLSGLLRRAREAVFLLDAEARIAFVNQAWERATGFSSEAALGLACPPRDLAHDDPLFELGCSFAPPPEAAAGVPASTRTLIAQPNGARVWRQTEFWPLHHARGSLLGWLGILRDLETPALAPESQSQRLRMELREARERNRDRIAANAIVGCGVAHDRLMRQIEVAEHSTISVLILGENGTGKRAVARAIHASSQNASRPLLSFDASALPAEALDRELSRVLERGGLSDATSSEAASLLIVDVLAVPRDIQAKLANELTSKRIRVLSTSTSDPDAALRSDSLRPDLYFELTGLVLQLRPLRQRLDEIPLLSLHFLDQLNEHADRTHSGFSEDALEAFRAYDWPGNLRELSRVVAAAHARCAEDIIGLDSLPAAIRGNLASAYAPPPMPPSITPLDEALEQVERRLIEHALQRARHNKSRAADLLAISRPRLYRRMKEMNIPDEAEEPAEDAPAPPIEPAPG